MLFQVVDDQNSLNKTGKRHHHWLLFKNDWEIKWKTVKKSLGKKKLFIHIHSLTLKKTKKKKTDWFFILKSQ